MWDKITEIFAPVFHAIGSLSWSADVVTALSVTVSAVLFMRNQKLERLAEARYRISESAKAPIIEYLFQVLGPLTETGEKLKTDITNFQNARPAILATNKRGGFVERAPERLRHIQTRLEDESDTAPIDSHMVERVISAELDSGIVQMLSRADEAQKTNQAIIASIRQMTARLPPILLSLSKGDQLLLGFQHHLRKHDERSTRLADLCAAIDFAREATLESAQERSLESILMGMLEFRCFVNSLEVDIASLSIPSLDYERVNDAPSDDYAARRTRLEQAVRELILPREGDLGRNTLLFFCLYRFLTYSIDRLDGHLADIVGTFNDTSMATSALLHVIISDPSVWATSAPIEEAMSRLRAA